MNTSLALSFLRGRYKLNTSLDFSIFPFDLGEYFLNCSFFLTQAFRNIFQRKIWVCRLLGEGFS